MKMRSKIFTNAPFDESNKDAEVYLHNLINKLDKGCVATDTGAAFLAQGSNSIASVTLYDYPQIKHFANAIPEFTNMMVTTNLLASHKTSVKPTASGKTSQGSKRSAERDTKPPFDKAESQKKVKEGFDAGIKKASEFLVNHKNDYNKMALDMAKHIQSLKPVFKTTDSTKNSLNLLFPLEFVDDKADWQLPADRKKDFLDGSFLGQFMVPSAILGYINGAAHQLPSNLQAAVATVKTHKMAENAK